MRAIRYLMLMALAGLVPAMLAAEPPRPQAEVPAAPGEEDAPKVRIRTIDNGDTVEEYRVNGRLTMVKVRPRNGPPYTLLDTNGDGRLDRRDSEGPVAPVYWTLYEWD